MLKWYIDSLHVDTSNLAIIRDLYGRMVRGVKPDGEKLPARETQPDKAARKEIYRIALQRHDENRALYRSVVTGRF